ncbi:MAG TPA: hypothetical protein VNY32_07035 [Candidatus Acidoferrales bacterium]|nr:hypothetical protein [Candidatus Acidoferrales bacterium]
MRPLVSIGKLLPVSTRRDLDRVAAVRQLDRRGSFVGFERIIWWQRAIAGKTSSGRVS